MRLLDDVMPVYDVNEFHELWMPCEPAAAYEAALAVRAREVRLLAPLMAVRMLPHALLRRRNPAKGGARSLIDAFLAAGFMRLAEEPGSELVLGAIGRFWSVTGNAPLKSVRTREDFVGFNEAGYARAATNLAFEGARGGTRVSTETRIVGTSPDASRRFRAYWTLIRLGSGVIRRSWLAAIRRRASSPASPNSR